MPGKRLTRNGWMSAGRWGQLLAAAAFGFAAAEIAAAREAAPVVQALLSSGQTIAGETISYPSGAPARITAAIVTFAPGQETGWHTHGIPAFGYILDGELTVDYGDQGSRLYKAGDALLEAIDRPHNGRNTGSVPMRILAVFMGAEGTKTSIPAPPPAPKH